MLLTLNKTDVPPPPAAAVGYASKTFASTFASSKFDMSGSNASGKEWYLFNFFGQVPSPSGLTLSASGVTIAGLGGFNGQISTVAQVPGNWVGTAFGGGGYFEATIEFDPAKVNTSQGWPAFWGMAIEHLSGVGEQWTGQAGGYAHFIEADIFEYDIAQNNHYGAGLHDWSGIWTPQTGFADLASDYDRVAPPAINWNSFHKVGMLWVPATATSLGSATFYLDDAQMGAVTWSKFTIQTPPPASPWAWGVFDQQHIPLILGTGINQGLSVQSVNVWQASGAANLVR